MQIIIQVGCAVETMPLCIGRMLTSKTHSHCLQIVSSCVSHFFAAAVACFLMFKDEMCADCWCLSVFNFICLRQNDGNKSKNVHYFYFSFLVSSESACVNVLFWIVKYGLRVWCKSMILSIWNRLDSKCQNGKLKWTKPNNERQRFYRWKMYAPRKLALQNEPYLFYSRRTYRRVWLDMCQWIINYFVLHWIRSNCFAFDFLSATTLFPPVSFLHFAFYDLSDDSFF